MIIATAIHYFYELPGATKFLRGELYEEGFIICDTINYF